MRTRFRSWPALLPAVLLVNGLVSADDYRLPPREVVEIVDAPPVPRVQLSPDRQWMILIEQTSLPPIEDAWPAPASTLRRTGASRRDLIVLSPFGPSTGSGPGPCRSRTGDASRP